MSDSRKPPENPPPDDYSKTTPNIDIPDDDSDDRAGSSRRYAAEAPPDDWGKTVINYNSSLEPDDSDDFGDTFGSGGGRESAEEPDWGMTQANVNLGGAFEAAEEDDFGPEEVETAATQHVIHIPELDRKKFQIPPTPTERVQEERREQRKQAGIPLWFWITAALMTMFFFALIIILGVYFFIIRDSGYQVVVRDAPIGSRFHIDNEGSWGVPSVNNDHLLSGLKEGERVIEIKKDGWECQPLKVNLKDGTNPAPLIANCRRSGAAANPISDKACDETRVVEDREKCAEQILDTLGNPPDLERLVKALNWLIINFESGKWDIPEARKRVLSKAASHMRNLPARVVIEIGGHTDDRGSDADNLALSDRRAAAVRDYLVNIGKVSPSTLQTKGYGEAKPKAENTTEQGRFDNRRIEYTVITR